MSYRYKNKQADQWLIIESLEIGLITYGQLIFSHAPRQLLEKGLSLQQMILGKNIGSTPCTIYQTN